MTEYPEDFEPFTHSDWAKAATDAHVDAKVRNALAQARLRWHGPTDEIVAEVEALGELAEFLAVIVGITQPCPARA